MENQRCCAEVNGPGGFNWYPCSNKAKVERDGKHYCNVHDPVRRAERASQQKAKWREEIEFEQFSDHQKWERERRAFQALELLEATYPDDPIGTLERLIAADKEAGE
jgi:hypothetical protein